MRIWPKYILEHHLRVGFPREAMDSLVKRRRGFLESFPKFSPIAFWETETYSFGKTYRNWLGWPWFMPLPMSGDHGMVLNRSLTEREVNSGARTFLTWSSWRTAAQLGSKIDVIQVPHPWVIYKRKRMLVKNEDARGTLVFVAHTSEELFRGDFDFKKYVESLKALPETFHPFSLCIQMHDVRKGLHKELLTLGLPIFTLGNSSSPFFVDRFYDLVLRFNFATSNVTGSQLFYCQEAGVPYFIFGQEHEQKTKTGDLHPYHLLSDRDLVLRVQELFTLEKLGESKEKSDFVAEALGLELDGEEIRRTIKKKLKSDLMTLSPLLLRRIFSNIFRFFRFW